MTTVPVHRPVLEWARRRSRRDTTEMRSRFKAWDRWLSGDAHPTFSQAQQLAEYTHVPFGALLMTTPPVEALPIPDFRVGRSLRPQERSNLLRARQPDAEPCSMRNSSPRLSTAIGSISHSHVNPCQGRTSALGAFRRRHSSRPAPRLTRGSQRDSDERYGSVSQVDDGLWLTALG